MDDWLHPLLRFAHYVLLLGLFGATAFRTTFLRDFVATKGLPDRRGVILTGAILAPLVLMALFAASITAMIKQPAWELVWATNHSLIVSTGIG